MGLFTTRQITAVKEYDYISENISLSGSHLHTVWSWFFKVVPVTWAANTLTLIGLLINIVTAFILFVCNPDGTPGWVHLVRAVGVFAYLAFDALDGMQGRRTRSGALEELYDHGFDSLSAVFVGLGGCFALQLTHHPYLLLAMMCLAEFVFYTSNWQHYVTGIMRFWRVDASEASLAVILIHIVCAISPDAFDRYVPVINLQLRYVCVVGNVVLSAFLASRHFYYISKGFDKRHASELQNTGHDVFPIVPIGMAIGLQLLVAVSTSIFTDQPCFYLVTFGIVVSKVTLTLIMAYITKDSMPYFDSILVGPMALLINQHISIFPEYGLLWVTCIYVILNWLLYFWKNTIAICDCLNIYCFNVTSRPRRV